MGRVFARATNAAWGDELGRSVFSTAERDAMLERILDRYVAEGWKVDDRFDGYAVISREWGAGYFMLGLRGVLKDKDGRPPERRFKRKDVRVDKFGNVVVSRAPSRGEKASRYKAPA
jgi:hypothetical protein